MRTSLYRIETGDEGGEEAGIGMERSTGRVILICEECGDRLVLAEPEEVWLSTRTCFECECGKDVSLASRPEESIPKEH